MTPKNLRPGEIIQLKKQDGSAIQKGPDSGRKDEEGKGLIGGNRSKEGFVRANARRYFEDKENTRTPDSIAAKDSTKARKVIRTKSLGMGSVRLFLLIMAIVVGLLFICLIVSLGLALLSVG